MSPQCSAPADRLASCGAPGAGHAVLGPQAATERVCPAHDSGQGGLGTAAHMPAAQSVLRINHARRSSLEELVLDGEGGLRTNRIENLVRESQQSMAYDPAAMWCAQPSVHVSAQPASLLSAHALPGPALRPPACLVLSCPALSRLVRSCLAASRPALRDPLPPGEPCLVLFALLRPALRSRIPGSSTRDCTSDRLHHGIPHC